MATARCFARSYISTTGSKELCALHQVRLWVDGWSILLGGMAVGTVSAFAAIWLDVRYRKLLVVVFCGKPHLLRRLILGMV